MKRQSPAEQAALQQEIQRLLSVPRHVEMALALRNGTRAKTEWAGWFYLIQLTPDLQPRRVKFGFTDSPSERLSAHRVSSPTAVLVKAWPAIWMDERYCIAAVTNDQCVRLSSEAWDIDDLDRVQRECDRYFEYITTVLDDDEYTALLRRARTRPAMDRLVEYLERLKEDWLDLHPELLPVVVSTRDAVRTLRSPS